MIPSVIINMNINVMSEYLNGSVLNIFLKIIILKIKFLNELWMESPQMSTHL